MSDAWRRNRTTTTKTTGTAILLIFTDISENGKVATIKTLGDMLCALQTRGF